MANIISEKWFSGQNPVPGTASVGYPHVDFTWNSPDDNNHTAVTSPAFAYPGRYFTIVFNGAAAATAGDYVYTLYGSNDSDLEIAKWDTIKTATIANADITALTTFVEVNTENDEAYYKYYKIKLDPDADPGPAITIRVGINAPAKNKG